MEAFMKKKIKNKNMLFHYTENNILDMMEQGKIDINCEPNHPIHFNMCDLLKGSKHLETLGYAELFEDANKKN